MERKQKMIQTVIFMASGGQNMKKKRQKHKRMGTRRMISEIKESMGNETKHADI